MLLREHQSMYTFRDKDFQPLESSSLFLRIPIEESARSLIVRVNDTIIERIDLNRAACIEGFCEGCAQFLGIECDVIEPPRPPEPREPIDQTTEGYQIPWMVYVIALVLIAIIILAIPRKNK